MKFTAADSARFDTWKLEMTAAVLGVVPRFDGDEAAFPNTALGLRINRRSGAWNSFAKAVGGYSGLRLLRCIKPNLTQDETIQWAIAWLATHPGTS
jgi:hypothetical protein